MSFIWHTSVLEGRKCIFNLKTMNVSHTTFTRRVAAVCGDCLHTLLKKKEKGAVSKLGRGASPIIAQGKLNKQQTFPLEKD